jgi:hypothetical protein
LMVGCGVVFCKIIGMIETAFFPIELGRGLPFFQ